MTLPFSHKLPNFQQKFPTKVPGSYQQLHSKYPKTLQIILSKALQISFKNSRLALFDDRQHLHGRICVPITSDPRCGPGGRCVQSPFPWPIGVLNRNVAGYHDRIIGSTTEAALADGTVNGFLCVWTRAIRARDAAYRRIRNWSSDRSLIHSCFIAKKAECRIIHGNLRSSHLSISPLC